MARKKVNPVHENHERWLVSYADFITLLFAFFVVMFASSQADRTKARQVSDSVREALEQGGVMALVRGVIGGGADQKDNGNAILHRSAAVMRKMAEPPVDVRLMELLPSLEYLSRELEPEIRSGKLQVRLTSRGLTISLQEAAFFPSGQDAIDPATYPTLEKIAVTLRGLPNPVRLEGHTDSVPIHTSRFRNNWELSVARSIAMLELLSQRFGIPEPRMAVAGYAATAPVESNVSAEGRARNRRVDIVILNHNAMAAEPAGATSVQTPLHEPPPGPAHAHKAARS